MKRGQNLCWMANLIYNVSNGKQHKRFSTEKKVTRPDGHLTYITCATITGKNKSTGIPKITSDMKYMLLMSISSSDLCQKEDEEDTPSKTLLRQTEGTEYDTEKVPTQAHFQASPEPASSAEDLTLALVHVLLPTQCQQSIAGRLLRTRV